MSGQADTAAGLRWALRAAGLLGSAAAIVLTPEVVARVLHGGQPLFPTGVESLLAYRALALLAGVSLLVFAQLLPRLAERPERLLETLGILLPLGVLAVCVAIKLMLAPQHPAYTSLVGEDGVVEYGTSACYLGAGVLAGLVARGLSLRDERLLGVLWAGLGVALVLACLEEISWGQRLFGVQTPELLEGNTQHEMNLHNLPLAQHFLHAAYIAVGLFASFARAALGDRGPARFREFASWLLPSTWLLPCFLPVALFYAVFDWTPSRWIDSDSLRFGFLSTFDQEPAELLLSLGFLLFAAQTLVRLRGAPAASDRQR